MIKLRSKPPYYVTKDVYIWVLQSDLGPSATREEGRNKVPKDQYMLDYRVIKHQGEYFVYKRKI